VHFVVAKTRIVDLVSSFPIRGGWPIFASIRLRLPHPAAIFGGLDTMLHAPLAPKPSPRDPVSIMESPLDTIVRDAHPSKSAKGEAAEFVVARPSKIKGGLAPTQFRRL